MRANSWGRASLSDIADINPKYQISKGTVATFVEMAALPVFSRDIETQSITQKMYAGSGAKFANGDTLVARITPCLENGKTAKVHELADESIGFGSTEFIVLSAKDKNDANFLYYLTRTKEFRDYSIARMEGTSGRQRVPSAAVSAFEFLCPSPNERRVIGQFLNLIDDRIKALKLQNNLISKINIKLYRSWFVNFDPVLNKTQNKALRGVDKETAKLFPSSLVDTKNGKLPSGWNYVAFGDLLEHTIGGDWGGENRDDKNTERVAIIRGTDIPDLVSGANSRVAIRYTTKSKLASRKLCHGDIVIEVSGGSKDQPTGRSILITDELLSQFDCPVEPASFCRLFRPKDPLYSPFLSVHLSHIYQLGKTWEYQIQSTGISNFQTTHFLNHEMIALPPKDILIAFNKVAEASTRRSQDTQIQNLNTLRDDVLPKLMAGQMGFLDLEHVLNHGWEN